MQQFDDYQTFLSKQEGMGCVYLITDSKIHDTSFQFGEEAANILRYTGKHCTPNHKRRENDHRRQREDYKGSRIDQAMVKRPTDFICTRIGVFPKEACLRMEAYYAEQFETYARSRGNHRDGYNINECGEKGRLGILHIPETKEKMHQAKLNQSPDTRAKNAAKQRGKKMSEETIEKIRASLAHPAVKDKIGSGNRGKKKSDEEMQPARDGNKRYWTPEAREAQSRRLQIVNEKRKAPERYCEHCNYRPSKNNKSHFERHLRSEGHQRMVSVAENGFLEPNSS